MARTRLSLYDTTLRDGAQTHGVDFSVEDKWLIAQQLDVLGLDYIEAGYPGANPTDTRLFAEARPLDRTPQIRDEHVRQREVVEIAPTRPGEVPRRETSRGAIVDAGRARERHVEQHEPEAAVGRGADGQITELCDRL